MSRYVPPGLDKDVTWQFTNFFSLSLCRHANIDTWFSLRLTSDLGLLGLTWNHVYCTWGVVFSSSFYAPCLKVTRKIIQSCLPWVLKIYFEKRPLATDVTYLVFIWLNLNSNVRAKHYLHSSCTRINEDKHFSTLNSALIWL